MEDLSRQSKGAIAEHYVIMRLLARGYTAANINFTVNNCKSVDILCSNPKLNKIIPIQVKSSFNKSKSFNIGLQHEDFCVNGAFDEEKALKSLEGKIVCPWIFVDVNTSFDIPTFRTFILTKKQVIKLAFESEKWYLNDVFHANPLNPKGNVALVLGWIEGFDTTARDGVHWRHHFSNPYPNTQMKFEEAWDNLWLDEDDALK